MIERIGRRTGLIAGGIVVGVVLFAMVSVFGYMLLVSGPAAHSAEEEVPPQEVAVAPPAPTALPPQSNFAPPWASPLPTAARATST